MTAKTFYVTTPIFYPNGDPHIGHAYTSVVADVLARFQRLAGRDVFFLSGTDEHGIKMLQTARAEGVEPIELADRNSQRFREMQAALDVVPDDFIRTTEPRHHAAGQEIWRRMEANGDIYLDSYSGWYSVRQEAFFDEKETTVRPDGTRVEPLGSPVEWVEEQSYFFRLSAYQERLLAHYEATPDFIAPAERRNEVVSFVKSGLRDLSISRTTFDWGIKVPGNDAHVMYVWVDALTNYLTATDWPGGGARSKYWPADLHLIGKDIVRFHAVYWPAFLMSANLPLPKKVFAHGFWLNSGEKMSKSLGNVVDPFSLTAEFGIDAVRYFFAREVSLGNDGDYSPDRLITRVNADLANNLGNLAQRSLSMINKNCDAKVPEAGPLAEADETLIAEVGAAIEAAQTAMDRQLVHEATGAIVAALSSANNYFAAQEPWALKKTDPERMATVLYVTADTVRRLTIPMLAFVPASAARLLDQMAVPAGKRLLADALVASKLLTGTDLPVPQGVFARLERRAE
ncbi:MAG TPA: methionine--tRNA ligase [Devosia sp.]|jgi:methionyl-tRNA synthetase|nr:methionine--tRNA ligase [Devosia sp.]